MTERRQLSSTSHGLFATKVYKTGDVILSSTSPLIRLAPVSKDEETSLAHTYFPNDKGQPSDAPTGTTLLERIDIAIPDGEVIVSSSSAVDTNRTLKTLQSMVQAALCYVQATLDDTHRERLLSLYHPPIGSKNSNTATAETIGHAEEEQAIVQLSSWALDYLKTLQGKVPESPLSNALASDDGALQLQKVMLIWACNSFANGRIYDLFSRINHSCNPNSVVVVDATNEEQQLLRAATEIHAGDEIAISYLDSWLYTDTPTRQAVLERDKFFSCRCKRCLGECRRPNGEDASFPDTAQSIPCPVCHPRVNQQLPEDVQYDDDLQVHYVCPLQVCPKCGFGSRLTHKATASAVPEKPGTYDKLFDTNQSVVTKVATFLRIHLERTSSKQSANRSIASNDKNDKNNDDLDECEIDVFYEQLTQHLTLASSVLGAKHWTTNLIMLHLLDQTLAGLHFNMLAKTMEGDNDDDKEETMETIASAIDMLERILRFVNGQNLNLHMGHLLSNVVVGTARALVGLGDVKSQKYAADWVSKLTGDSDTDSGFVHFFESPGIQKVVETLKSAWQRHPDSERPEKRTKR